MNQKIVMLLRKYKCLSFGVDFYVSDNQTKYKSKGKSINRINCPNCRTTIRIDLGFLGIICFFLFFILAYFIDRHYGFDTALIASLPQILLFVLFRQRLFKPRIVSDSSKN